MLTVLARQALRQMLRYRTQTALAVLGVAIGVANIIMLISITDLGKRQSTGLLRDFGSYAIMVTPFFDLSGAGRGGNAMVAAAHIPSETVQIVRAVPQIQGAAGFLLLPGHASYGGVSCFTTIAGIQPEFAALISYVPVRGRWLSAADEVSAARVCCLGDSVAHQLFGGTDPVGKQIEVKGQQLTVLALMQHKGRVGLEDFDNRVIVPLRTAQQLYDFQGLNAVLANYRPEVREQDAVNAVRSALATLLKPGESLDETYSVFTMDEARKLLDDMLGIFRAVLAGIASIAMLVAGIGIMNVMLIRVLQRRKEIGVRRAVGATPWLIALQFLLEAVVQALAGAVLGLALGIFGVQLYCRYAQWQPFISPLTVLLAVVYSVGVGLLFGAYPALRAARMDPIAGLRQDI
jgi:putative ABC transport system permease protein